MSDMSNSDGKTTGWIGVDLDGTLAYYDGWGDGSVGRPIPQMVQRVKEWLAAGKDVRIFTARVGPHPSDTPSSRYAQLKLITEWCQEHLGKVLLVTCSKDYEMIELWDDRCVQMIPNEGISISDYYRSVLLPGV